MDIAQENFERAIGSGYTSLKMLAKAVEARETPQLRDVHTRKLQSLAWDLEAIQAAIRIELNGRSTTGHMDMS